LFQTCEQKYKWKYVDDLEPRWDGVPKPLGTAFHSGVAEIYQGEDVLQATHNAVEKYYELVGKPIDNLTEKEAQQVGKGRLQLEAMLAHYPYVPERFEDIVAIEKDMEWEVVPGRSLVFRADRLIRVNGALWLHDTKTTGLEVNLMVKVQRLRTQYVGYAAGVEALTGEKLAGVMLDAVHKPPVYFKKTGEFSSMKEPGYVREPIHKTEAQLAEFVEWFRILTMRIEDMEPQGLWLKNTDACLAYNRTCPYLNLCLRPEWSEGMKELYDKREQDYADEGEEDAAE